MESKISVSKTYSLYTQEYLQAKEENQYFERKGLGEKDIKPAKIADELIGMLNADGGALFFGIADSGEFQDLNSANLDLGKYRSLVFDFIQPMPNIEFEEIVFDNKLLFAYHVEQDCERVFCRKESETVFLRVHDTNRKLDREAVRKLEYDKQIRKFEEEIQENFDVDDFDLSLLEQYKEKLNYTGKVFDLLEKRHLSVRRKGKLFYKKAALLLFAKDPEKYIPSASIRYIRYDGNEALTGTTHNVIKDERFENNIPKLIDELKYFLKTSFKDYYFLSLDNGKFNKVMEYPEEAWLEALVNALCHRSYNIQGSSIYIKHFDNRFEVSNSGPLPAQVNIENIKDERFSRNPRIARVLEDLGYVRQLNEGVKRIYESMEKSMLSVPEYKQENNNVYLTLRNKISVHSRTISEHVIKYISDYMPDFNDTQKKIVYFLFAKQEAILRDFTADIGINSNTIRLYLNKFIDAGIIERISHKQRDKNAKYRFKKD